MTDKITIKLVHTGGPFGDCTDNYDIETNATTVGEFINAVIGRDNFQTFCIRRGNGISANDVCLAYAEHGEVKRKASNYDFLLSLKLKSAKVNGGYGNMGYAIWIEGELPTQDRDEFEMTYWGYTFK